MKTISLLLTSLLLGSVALTAAEKKEPKPSGELTALEVKFVKKAGVSGKAEAAMGELAKTGASREDVKDFGKMMADDHGGANAKLAAIAEKNSVKILEPGEKNKEALGKLAKLQGAEFDTAFLNEMLTGHEKSVKLFKNAQGTVTNKDLKEFIDNTLPTLEAHLAKVKELTGTKAEEPATPAQS